MKLKHDSTPKRVSGPGAAHIGFAMFGARGPLLNLVNEGSGGAGGGQGGQNPPPNGQPSNGAAGGGGGQNPPPQGGQPSNGGAGGEARFTQADVDRIVKERLAREGNRGSGGQQNPPPRNTNENQGTTGAGNGAPSGAAPDNDPSWIFDLTDAMDTVTDELGVRPTAGAKKKLREDFQRTRPDDATGYVKQWFTDMGLVPSTPNPNPNPNAGAAANSGTQASKGNPNVPPRSDNGPPSGGPREFESITDPNDLTRDDIDRLVSKHGETGANQKIRELAERWASRTKIKIGPARR